MLSSLSCLAPPSSLLPPPPRVTSPPPLPPLTRDPTMVSCQSSNPCPTPNPSSRLGSGSESGPPLPSAHTPAPPKLQHSPCDPGSRPSGTDTPARTITYREALRKLRPGSYVTMPHDRPLGGSPPATARKLGGDATRLMTCPSLTNPDPSPDPDPDPLASTANRMTLSPPRPASH